MPSFQKSASILLSLGLAGFAIGAETLYSITATELQGKTLFDQRVSDSALVTVKPLISPSFTGDVNVLEQCLWSVKISLAGGEVDFTAGKMICVGPHLEVLESIPDGVVQPFGACTDDGCTSFDVEGNTPVMIQLNSPLLFTLQPRNERN